MESEGKKIDLGLLHPTAIFILVDGPLATGENQGIVFIPVKSREDRPEPSKLLIWSRNGDSHRSETQFLPGEPILVFGSKQFEMVPPSPYIPVLLPTSPLKAEETDRGV